MATSVAKKPASRTTRKPAAKEVRLKLVYVDFWSAVKFSFLVSTCLAVVGFVATILVFVVLLQTGVFNSINELFMDVVSGDDFNLTNMLGLPQVAGFALVVGILNIIVGTALGAVSSIVYNQIVRVLGGFQLGFTSN
jgi:hypothetical protein